jgi:hypothetical protein
MLWYKLNYIYLAYMNIYELKILIKEVIRETKKILAEAVEEQEEPKAPDIGMKHSLGHEREYGTLSDTIVRLKLGGVNKNAIHIIKDFIAQAAYEAKMNDLKVINADIQKQGKSVLAIDEPELRRITPTEADIDRELAAEPKDPDEMTPEERLALIKPGEKAAEWKAMEKQEREENRKKAELKKAKIAAGTYDPNDTSLWTDRDWDIWNREHPEETPSGKGYRPSYKKSKTGQVMPRLGLGTLKH